MGEWDLVRLGDVIDMTSGGTPRMSEPRFWGGDIPWISATSMKSERLHDSDRRVTEAAIGKGTRLASPDSTLILVRGMALLQEMRIGRPDRPVAFNQDVKALTPRDPLRELDPGFLLYALLSRRTELLTMVHQAGHGTGVLSTDRLKDLLIPLPPIDEQRSISGALAAFDLLAEVTECTSASCAALRRELIFRAIDSWQSSRPLSDLARFVNGKNFTKQPSGTGRAVIRTPEVRYGPGPTSVYNNVEAPDDHLARPGDMLFVWSGSLMAGRWLHDESLINQHIFKVLPFPDVPSWLVYSLIEWRMPAFLGVASDKATTMGHIQRHDLDVPVPVPNDQQLKQLQETITPLWDAEYELALEAIEVRRTRDDLLGPLVSGQITLLDGVNA